MSLSLFFLSKLSNIFISGHCLCMFLSFFICIVFVFFFFFGHDMCSRPSDQLSKRSHVSVTALQCSENSELKTSLIDWLTQGHLSSCPGQLKLREITRSRSILGSMQKGTEGKSFWQPLTPLKGWATQLLIRSFWALCVFTIFACPKNHRLKDNRKTRRPIGRIDKGSM